MTDAAATDRPAEPPVEIGTARIELAWLFLQGDGLEIGALHLPTTLPAGCRVRYVDRMPVADLRRHYAELAEFELTPVDVIDDGERLASIEAGSVDFIVANHFLEHCQDPIATIEAHLDKLRPGGTLFYAVPDKRYTFDFRRSRTPLQHLIDDHRRGPQRSRAAHYLEWARLVVPDGEPPSHEQAQATATELERAGYSIHFHVWTQADLAELIYHLHERLGTFEVEAIRGNGSENIVVLRKHGERPPRSDGAAEPMSTWTSRQPDAADETPQSVADLRARIAELERQLVAERGAHMATRARAEQLDRRLVRAERVLGDVLASGSWQITRPLRFAKRQMLKRYGSLRAS